LLEKSKSDTMIYTVTPAPNMFPGVHRLLTECEQFGTKHIYLSQLNQVTKEDIVIFGAWEPNSYPMAIRRCKAKKKALLWTSPLLQSQMNEPELEFLDTILQLKQKGVIDILFFTDQEAYHVFENFSDDIYCFTTPCNIKNMEEIRIKLEEEWKGNHKDDIFCFMPWGNKNKNQITQLAAVKLFQENNPDTMFFANGMGNWRKWAVILKLNFEDLGFLPEDKYYKYIFTKGCGLHVTLSESFGYCVLDAFLLKTPVLCSPAIDWAPPEVITANSDDPVSMAEDLERIYDSCNSIGEGCRRAALLVSGVKNDKVKSLLKQIIQ